MALLIIIGIILFLLLAILFLRIRFDIIVNEDIIVRLNIFGIKIQLFPKKERKTAVKNFKKGYPKEPKKAIDKKETTKKNESASEEKTPVSDKISTIVSLVKLLFSRFFKHLRLDVSKIIVIVGGHDAASCAISYGIISQSVAYLLNFLDNHLNIHKKRRGTINVLCDFTSKTTVYDIFISASLNTWQILDIAFSLVYNYFNGKDVFNIKNLLTGGKKHNGRK